MAHEQLNKVAFLCVSREKSVLLIFDDQIVSVLCSVAGSEVAEASREMCVLCHVANKCASLLRAHGNDKGRCVVRVVRFAGAAAGGARQVAAGAAALGGQHRQAAERDDGADGHAAGRGGEGGEIFPYNRRCVVCRGVARVCVCVLL